MEDIKTQTQKTEDKILKEINKVPQGRTPGMVTANKPGTKIIKV